MDLKWSYILFYILFLLIAGYLLPFVKSRKLARISAWAIAVVTVAVSSVVTADQLPLISMLIIVFLQLLSMKIVVSVESYTGENKLNVFQWLAFSLGWFGMRPILFEKLPSASLPFISLLWKGMSRIFIGLLLLYLSTIAEKHPGAVICYLPELLTLMGLSLILHFGLLNVSTAGWRSLGVNVTELFPSPYKSKSLKEFWGRRWNIAFSEMTALIAYRPLKTKIGTEKAVVVSFLLSGLLHEIAISFPAKGGYGLPMLYFAIHAAAMHLESRSGIVKKIIARPLLSHVWVMTVLILPMPLLFHAKFIGRVLIPLRDMLVRVTDLV